MGGIHASSLPAEAVEYCDSVVIGEAEYLWQSVVNDAENGCLKRKYENNSTVDLASCPVPKYGLLSPKYKAIWIQTSRGCPVDCEFCAASKVYGKKYRRKAVDQVVREIKEAKRFFPNAFISFSDDNFTVNREYTKQLCREIIPLKIRYAIQSDISVANDPELLTLLRESGCFSLFIGFESVNAQNLEGIDRGGLKRRQFDNYPSIIHTIQSHGLAVHGAFILGLDHDTVDTSNAISEFIINNRLSEAQITLLTPLPGTRLRQKLADQNRLLNNKWENFTFCDVNIIHPNMTKEQLEEGIVAIYQKINTPEVYKAKIEYFKQIQIALLKKSGSLT